MILEEGKEYQLVKDLKPLLNLTTHSIKTRKEDLLIWFENFFDFEIVKQKPFTIKILKIKEEYQPLPRKVEKNAASAFYRQEQGEDISDERDAYQRARDKFRDTLVLVKKWKNKEK